MKLFHHIYLTVFVWLSVFTINAQSNTDFEVTKLNDAPNKTLNFEKFYGEMFKNIQESHVFPDQKTFVDAEPRFSPDSILSLYLKLKDNPGFNLKLFVAQNFTLSGRDTLQMLQHLNFLWNDLTRHSKIQNPNSTLISLPFPYIVPGGRFNEIFYWDSYFTMLGLEVSGRIDLIENMIRNFAYLIDTYGHIPNGNRTYFLSRSQPPFFAMMVELLAEAKADSTVYVEFLPQLVKEFSFWNNPSRNVEVEPGKYLTQYWDENTTPRPEAWSHSLKFYKNSHRDSLYYRDERAACESGWDFSSRWFTDSISMEKMNTTQLLQVDLNSLLFKLEETIAAAYKIQGNTPESDKFSVMANTRKELINRYFWDKKTGFFYDYDLVNKKQSPHLTMAGVFPLFLKIATPKQAVSVTEILQNKFLFPGGLVTTLIPTREQWDYPNGWAPLQWVGYQGLKNYESNQLADKIARNWTNLNIKVYIETGKMMEKYNVVDVNKPGGGGEYASQDGFGWTNGVFLKMWNELNKK